jgi:hypothetical protein
VLTFFVAWPNLLRADEIVREREKEMDRSAFDKLRPVVAELEKKYAAGASPSLRTTRISNQR